MSRTIVALSVVLLIAALAGCRMCADLYDDCGPLFTGESCGPPCGAWDRSGSILSGGSEVCGCDSCGHQAMPALPAAGSDQGPPDSDKIEPTPDDYTKPTPQRLPTVHQARAPRHTHRR